MPLRGSKDIVLPIPFAQRLRPDMFSKPKKLKIKVKNAPIVSYRRFKSSVHSSEGSDEMFVKSVLRKIFSGTPPSVDDQGIMEVLLGRLSLRNIFTYILEQESNGLALVLSEKCFAALAALIESALDHCTNSESAIGILYASSLYCCFPSKSSRKHFIHEELRGHHVWTRMELWDRALHSSLGVWEASNKQCSVKGIPPALGGLELKERSEFVNQWLIYGIQQMLLLGVTVNVVRKIVTELCEQHKVKESDQATMRTLIDNMSKIRET